MPANLYDPDFTARYFDEFGEQEWYRLVKTPAEEVKLFIHTQFLERYITKDSIVLDIGAGPGRFTKVLVKLGATVVVGDISQTQLDLNKRFANEFEFAYGIKNYLRLDICDMSIFPDSTFDHVVCYGNPLGYVFEKRELAFGETLRVLKPGGKVFLSVSTLWGSIHELLPGVLSVDAVKNEEIIRSGNLYFEPEVGLRHRCHLFRAAELKEFLEKHPLTILNLSASNCISAVWGDKLESIRADRTQWDQLLKMELEACQQTGCLEMGSHLIAVVEKQVD
jgi:SAM-dependent methyltransferase